MTHRYVFSYISFYDNDLRSKLVESDDDILTVAKQELGARNQGEVYHEYSDDVEGLKRFAFDCDSMFEIIEI